MYSLLYLMKLRKSIIIKQTLHDSRKYIYNLQAY